VKWAKTPEQIDKIRKACQIAGLVLEELKAYMKDGITTQEVDRIAEEMILKNGALPAFKGYRGYQHATCISINEEVVHGIPGPKKLKNGDIVGVDVGTIFSGFYGDTARTYPVGEISEKAKRLLNCGKECLETAIMEARAGNHIGDISHVIEAHARKAGFTVVKDLFGHGVGVELHEDPLIPNFGDRGEGMELIPNMVLAIEPMVNVGGSRVITLNDGWTVITEDRKLSAHFEHTVLITEGEPEVLTCLKTKM
jgi:methionyl aminopeptidase